MRLVFSAKLLISVKTFSFPKDLKKNAQAKAKFRKGKKDDKVTAHEEF